MAKPKLSDDGRTVTVRVPISIRKRGGRKVVFAPNGDQSSPQPPLPAIRQLNGKDYCPGVSLGAMLESGEYATILEIANAEKINESVLDARRGDAAAGA